MSDFFNKIIGHCNDSVIDLIKMDDDDYSYVKTQLTLAIQKDKSFIDSMCKSYLDHKFITDNLYNIILAKNKDDLNNILGLASYNIVEKDYKKVLKIWTLCSNNKCGKLLMNIIKDIAEYEDCNSIRVIAISPSIGFYWKMGFKFLIDNSCFYYTDNELARNEREIYEEIGSVELSSQTLEQLERYKLAWVKDDNYIMTFCIKNEDENLYEED